MLVVALGPPRAGAGSSSDEQREHALAESASTRQTNFERPNARHTGDVSANLDRDTDCIGGLLTGFGERGLAL